MQQIAPKSRSYKSICESCIRAPKEGVVCLRNSAVQFLTAPCSSRVQIPEPQDFGGSIILPLAGTKAVQQCLLVKFQVKEGLDPELVFCAFGGSCLPSVSEEHLQAGCAGAPALVTACSQQLELGSLHGTLQAGAPL